MERRGELTTGQSNALPPYTPELQPAEHRWLFTNGALVNAPFADPAVLEDVQFARCAAVQRHLELVRVVTRFPWWLQRIRKQQGPRRT